MKPLHAKGLGVLAMLAIAACGTGCFGYDNIPPAEGSGGVEVGDLGLQCLWAESREDLKFPVCPSPVGNEFMGTIDGKPYDHKDSANFTGMAPPSYPPYSLSISISGAGSLDLVWNNPYVRGRWLPVSSGMLILPEDGKLRPVFRDSQLLLDCEDYSFLYILHVDGGTLTGCSR